MWWQPLSVFFGPTLAQFLSLVSLRLLAVVVLHCCLARWEVLLLQFRYANFEVQQNMEDKDPIRTRRLHGTPKKECITGVKRCKTTASTRWTNEIGLVTLVYRGTVQNSYTVLGAKKQLENLHPYMVDLAGRTSLQQSQ